MRYVVAACMAFAFIAEIGSGFASGGPILALVYGLAGLGAGVAVILYLRHWASTRRGARSEVWGAGCARIAFAGSRRDVTGMRYQLLELRRRGYATRRFVAYDLTGALPPEAAAVSDA